MSYIIRSGLRREPNEFVTPMRLRRADVVTSINCTPGNWDFTTGELESCSIYRYWVGVMLLRFSFLAGSFPRFSRSLIKVWWSETEESAGAGAQDQIPFHQFGKAGAPHAGRVGPKREHCRKASRRLLRLLTVSRVISAGVGRDDGSNRRFPWIWLRLSVFIV
jgi:hypothetical protein